MNVNKPVQVKGQRDFFARIYFPLEHINFNHVPKTKLTINYTKLTMHITIL